MIAALLYAGLCLGANPAAAQVLNAAQRGEVDMLRQDALRKLVVHPKPIRASHLSFTDADGAPHTFSETDGKVRLVNFWATWCAPCREENPSLDALQREMGGANFEVISIATGRNDIEAIKDFNRETGIAHLPILLDPMSELARDMDVPGLPVTVILNREGDEIARLLGGADWNSASAKSILTFLTGLPSNARPAPPAATAGKPPSRIPPEDPAPQPPAQN